MKNEKETSQPVIIIQKLRVGLPVARCPSCPHTSCTLVVTSCPQGRGAQGARNDPDHPTETLRHSWQSSWHAQLCSEQLGKATMSLGGS